MKTNNTNKDIQNVPLYPVVVVENNKMNKQVQRFQFHPVFIEDFHTFTTSLNVAKYFSKRHDHVIRDIEKLRDGLNFGLVSLPNSGGPNREFSTLNFERSDYVDSRGKVQRMYKMTKNGFMILVMGYTGPKAMQIKLAYIEAFDFMEWKLMQPVRERETKMMAYYEREAVRRERRANKFSEVELTRMVEMANNRYTIAEISNLLQRSRTTIQDHMRKARQAGLIIYDAAQASLFPEVR
jgi:Rha family phage regulatory protein